MKFLKVLSTGAIAAAILASMSATAFAEDYVVDDDDDGLAFADDADDELAVEEADDDEAEEVSDYDDGESDYTVEETAGEDEDFATETEDETDEAEDADFGRFAAGKKKKPGSFAGHYSWLTWNWEDPYETGFVPASVGTNCTLYDVVNAAQASGVNALNIQSLSNFLILNEDHFTSDDYAAFIAVCYAAKEEIIDEHVADIWGNRKTAGSLSDEDRYRLYDSLSRDEKDAILAALINVGNRHGVLVALDNDVDGYPVIYASMRNRIAATETSSSANTQVAAGSAVAATGGELPETGSTGAAAFAGVALALAAAGVVLVARKNKA